MIPLNQTVKPEQGTLFTRRTTRAIVLNGTQLLVLYTARYDDYTLPGGGIDINEDVEQALLRELQEETGVQSILESTPFGRYEEYRPWYKDDFDFVHIISDCYVCKICGQFSAPQMEKYELENGMRPMWLDINDAINHNKHTLANSSKKGLSIQREIFLMEKIRDTLIEP